MTPYNSRETWLFTALYCGFVLVIYIPGISDYLYQFAGRQGVVIDAALNASRLAGQLATYALTILILNLLPLALLLVSLRRTAHLRERLAIGTFTQFLLAMVCAWLAILCFNKLYFPNSSFEILIPLEGRGPLMLAGGAALGVYALLGIVPALSGIVTRLTGLARRPLVRLALGGILAFSVIPPLYSHWMTPTAIKTVQPNIIIIGMDSVAPLHLQRYRGKLPILEKLLAHSEVFANNITPLARTFPAWTSILTAKYPVHTGARFNLTAFDQVETRATLPNILKAQGYSSVYAQDDRQFNNIDEQFGFDHVIGPTPGAADLVLSKAADHPLANLALLTPWAQTLFPYVALNRAASTQYDPDTFVTAILDGLPKQQDKPLFLATHFCLAHVPYSWRDSPSGSEADKQAPKDHHLYVLQRLEQQIDSLLQALKQSGRLDNAILVILSDHGEGLGYQDALWPSVDRHPSSKDVINTEGYTAFESKSGFTGHGMNTLDRTEYQSVLAFQGFGKFKDRFKPGQQDRITSLVDITPTLLAALGQPLPQGLDGINLLAPGPDRNTRTVIAETGLRFVSLASIPEFNEAILLKESHKYYRLDPDSTRLVLKKETYPELVSGKDLTVHTDDWMLALLRKPGNPYYSHVALLVHKPTGAWTTGNDMALIGRAPLAVLTQRLQQAYGRELDDFATLWPFNLPPRETDLAKPSGELNGTKDVQLPLS